MKLQELDNGRPSHKKYFHRSIVIGKFYPPHKGHRYLIEKAAEYSKEVTVIVCDQTNIKLSPILRAKWLEEMVPGIKILIAPESNLSDDDSRGWAEYTIKLLGFIPDAVFTSEDYGDAYAKFLGSTHVLVDRDRVTIPISGTKVRENPQLSWQWLDPPVRAYFTKRVVVLGAESTGTTTMAKALAQNYETPWVPEYGRTYYEGKIHAVGANTWQTNEFVFIAEEQNRLEDELARVSNKLLICDTDSFATTLWHERYMGFMSDEVEKRMKDRHYDLYLLTDVDIPFVQDGTRDGEYIRKKMHERFKEELVRHHKPFKILSASHEKRLSVATQAIAEVAHLSGKI
jgi:NadR type nicotinamide-nucleotide adenylyltransferase